MCLNFLLASFACFWLLLFYLSPTFICHSAIFLFQASPPVTLDGRRLSIEERRGKSYCIVNINFLKLSWQVLFIVFCDFNVKPIYAPDMLYNSCWHPV